VTLWERGIDALRNQSGPSIDELSGRALPWRRRAPVLVTGSAGAGKTAIWRLLTGKSAPDARSTRPDEGRVSLMGRAKRDLSLITIPGQISLDRYRDMKLFFGEFTQLEGVIFVATFGFDTIWQDEADDVAARLAPYNMDTLSQRNIDNELDSFRETCFKLAEKRAVTSGALGPRWLLVIVNKVDLMWHELAKVQRYYLPGGGEPFDAVARTLRERTLAYGAFRYDILPLALDPQDYVFAPNFTEPLATPSHLSGSVAGSSFQLLLTALEELCGA